MLRIRVVCIGKLNMPFYAAGVAEYEKRLAPYCRFETTELAEETLDEKNASPALVAAALEKEGARILAAVPKSARLFALCIEGKQLSSEEFSAQLASAALAGVSDIAFAIGSSHGLGPAVKQRAHALLSLSKMTFPHQLARLVLAEQVYRAMMIQSGGRYHK